MRVELNIGLDCQDQPNTQELIDARAEWARQVLSKHLIFSRRFTTSYPGPDGQQVNERGLFVALETNNMLSATLDIYKLSEAIGQDCIAVFYPRKNNGLLIGPKADKWGQFEPAHFRRFDRPEERLAA